MPIVLDGTNGITQADQFNSDSTFGFKNRIINGAMVIDQRNAGASSTTPTVGTGVYTIDRFAYVVSQASKFTIQQTPSTTETGFATRVGAGFSNYLACTVGASANVTIGASDYFIIYQPIEGSNVSDLAWGTANAKTVTLSFLVYSSVTGTFGGALRNGGFNRSYPFTYSIPTANTWTSISITIAGDTSGTWSTTNSTGIIVNFSLGVSATLATTAGAWTAGNYSSATGAVSPITTNSATFYITGVQLEAGSTATSFDYRPYGTELALCQRYCINYRSADAGVYMRYGSGYANSTTNLEINVHFPVTMRTNPSLTVTSTASNYGNYVAGGVNACSSVPALDSASDNPSVSTVNASSTGTFSSSGGGSILSNNNTTSYMLFTAEL